MVMMIIMMMMVVLTMVMMMMMVAITMMAVGQVMTMIMVMFLHSSMRKGGSKNISYIMETFHELDINSEYPHLYLDCCLGIVQHFMNNISRTSAVSSTNFRSILIFAI